MIRKLSTCVIEKFNGFTIVRVENDRSVRKIFYSIDINYKPFKKITLRKLSAIFQQKYS